MTALLLSLLCLALNAFFVAAEFALVKVRATQISPRARRGERRAIAAEKVIARLDRYLSVTQLGITVASLGLGWIAEPAIDVILTTGGTGLTGRDVTPEALRPLFDKEIEGFATVWHMLSYQSVGLSTLQSRACAGIVRGKFIFALPGSNGACRDGWDKIIRWQLDSRHAPCNMVELMPRLLET